MTRANPRTLGEAVAHRSRHGEHPGVRASVSRSCAGGPLSGLAADRRPHDDCGCLLGGVIVFAAQLLIIRSQYAAEIACE